MNPSQPSNRRRRETVLSAEPLESRELLTGSVGDTIAVIPGTIGKANQPAAIKFTIDPAHFTAPKGHFTLGIDVAPMTGSNLKPQIVSMTSPAGANVAVSHAKYAPGLPGSTAAANTPTTAVLATVQTAHKNPNGSVTYKVNVRGLAGTTGGFLVGFYLPGNASGSGTVTATDLSAVKSELGFLATNAKYTFDADANRDGRIDAADLAIAQQNLGVSTTISPTLTSHLDAAGQTLPNSRVLNVPSAHFTGQATPGASVRYQATAAGGKPVTTAADGKGDYSITVPLAPGNNTFTVTTSDAFGQSISGSLAPVTYTSMAMTMMPVVPAGGKTA